MALEKIAPTTTETSVSAQRATGLRLSEILRNHDVILTDVSGQTFCLQSEGYEEQKGRLHVPATWHLGERDIDATAQMHELAASVTGVTLPIDATASGEMAIEVMKGERSVGIAYLSTLASMEKTPLVELQLVQQ
ncbi:MAG TPA: hypothetical protein VGE30_02175 [Candidatus Saccharimonadales bacterium]